MAKYSIFIRPDLTQVFLARMQAGDVISEAVALIDEQADRADEFRPMLAAFDRGAAGI